MKINTWIYEVSPERYGLWPEDSGEKGYCYIVRSESYGLYTKAEAKIIAQFLRLHFNNLVVEATIERKV